MSDAVIVLHLLTDSDYWYLSYSYVEWVGVFALQTLFGYRVKNENNCLSYIKHGLHYQGKDVITTFAPRLPH